MGISDVVVDRRKVLAGGLAMLAAGAGPAIAAEKYPNRPITLVVPFGAGSVTDATTRLLADHLSNAFGVAVIVENKAGGGGIPASLVVARAPADGYMLVMTTNTTNSAVQALFKTVPYDPIKDFTHVARMAGFPSLIVAHPDLPAKTIQELVSHAKANPGALEYGYGNSGAQIAGEMLKSATNINIVRVGYRSNPQAMTDLIAGHIKLAATDLNTALPHIRSGKIRALAMAPAKRSTIVPEIPTLSETVVPGFDMLSWYGLAGPAGMPREIVDTLAVELHRFVERPEIREKLAGMGTEVVWTGPEEIDAFMRSEREKWIGLVKGAGIEPE
jgi:tripartite-type tricarboxylate transporter receptor subunit TctC